MVRVMSAHQPNFLPYLGFFDKMINSDVFVIRDEVDFVERDYHHRNRIRIDGKNADGEPQWKWLTIPVKKDPFYIKDIVIKNEVKEKNVSWNVYMLRQIKSNYETTPFFKQYFPELERTLLNRREKLIDLSMDVINFLKECFDIKTEIVYASKLVGYQKNGSPIQDLADIAKATCAEVYLSGAGGRNYLSTLEPFEKEGIKVEFQDYHHPAYRQRFWGFAPYMSAIDGLFNVGPGILRNGSDKIEAKEVVQMQPASVSV